MEKPKIKRPRPINKVKLICPCGTEFAAWPKEVRDGRKCCSKKCGDRYRKPRPKQPDIIKNCSWCNKEFVAPRGNHLKGYAMFCTKDCAEEEKRNNPDKLKASSDRMKKWLEENQRERHPRYKGGICENGGGYVTVYSPDHPKAYGNRKLEHRLVMEKHLGRLLERHEHVHHIDGNKKNNSIENLQLVTSQREHITLHMIDKYGGKPSTSGWSTIWDSCVECGKTDRKHMGKGLCKICYNRQWKHERKKKADNM